MAAPGFIILVRIVLPKMSAPAFLAAHGSLQNQFGSLRGNPQLEILPHLTRIALKGQLSCLSSYRPYHVQCSAQLRLVSQDPPFMPHDMAQLDHQAGCCLIVRAARCAKGRFEYFVPPMLNLSFFFI